MKILQLTHKPPMPCIDGGCLAMKQITSSFLNAGNIVKVISITTEKHPIIHSDETTRFFNQTQFQSVFINTKIKLGKLLTSFFNNSSIQANRFYSKEMDNKLMTVLSEEKFDVVILESIFVGHYIETIREYSQARIILRVHNIEHLIWERLSKKTKNPVKKIIYKYLSNSLKRFELSLFHKIDGFIPITEVDHQFFKEKFPKINSMVIPFAVDLSNYPYKEHKINKNRITFFHIGSMNWQPNIEGMNWFLNNIWEKAVAKYPNIFLILAGKGNKKVFENKSYTNVQIFDFVEDAQQFMKDYDIMIVPLLSGSGMRIKIMEGMALGKPIITTTTGAEGIEITDKENIFIADTPEEMMQVIEYCRTHIEECETIGKNARQLVENRYNQEKITKDLIAILYS